MCFTLVFTPAARAEVIEAQDWYEREAPGLSRRFLVALDAVAERMSSSPRQFPVVFRTVRRALLRRFPYARLFVIDGETVLVIACFHASRNPSRWQARA